MGFKLHASNSDDPPEVRNWRIHLMAVIVSMGSLASRSLASFRLTIHLANEIRSGI